MNQGHPLEVLLASSAEDILTAISRGFRTIVDVKGKLAELYLERELKKAQERGDIARMVRNDKDGEPDFRLERGRKTVRLECKNVRSGPAKGDYRVELQRTRNSKDGSPTRGYRPTDFEILAACLFNQTGRWEFLYAPTCELRLRDDASGLLKVMQPVPRALTKPWRHTLAEALRDLG